MKRPFAVRAAHAAAIVAGLVVLTCVGVVTVPEISFTLQRGRLKRTMRDMRRIAESLEAYSAEHHGYPAATELESLAAVLEPTYVADLPRRDGWRHGFDVSMTHVGYVIRSRGRDGAADDAPWVLAADPRATEAGAWDDDVVFSSGRFARCPEGTQR